MKVLHFSTHYRISPGIVSQISYEQSAALALDGVQWDNVIFTCQGKSESYVIKRNFPGGKFVNYFLTRLAALFWLARNAKQYDVVLLRHNLGDPFEFVATQLLKRYVTVHHTIEIDEARGLKGLSGKIQFWLEKFLGKMILNRAVGIVGVTREIADHEQSRISRKLPQHIYTNGIDYINYPNLGDERSEVPRFLFVAAQFSPWHGLDRIIDALAADATTCEVHVVGHCTPEQLLSMSTDPRFHCHGELTQAQIQGLSAQMDVGLSSMALDRNGLKEACTLKVREYLAGGLPVYSGHTDAGLPPDFLYYHKGEPVVTEMIRFAKEMRQTERAVVREHAKLYIDKMALVQQLTDWLRALH